MNEINPLQPHTILPHALIEIFGGVVHALNAHRTGESKGFGDFLALSVISSFSGIIFALVCIYFFQNEYITLAAAGCGGYLGTEGLSVIAKKIQQLLTDKV